MNKIRNIVGNSLWQLMPSIFTLLLSLAVVRFFSTSLWGTIVGIVVVQQIVNSVLAWGNKDFLQREIAVHASEFKIRFTALLGQRFVVFLLLMPILYVSGCIAPNYFTAFVLLVLGRFLQQSFDILILKDRKFKFAIVLELSFLVLQLLALVILKNSEIDSVSIILTVFWLPALLKSIVLSLVFKNYFVFGKPKEILLSRAFFFALLSFTGLVHSKIDLLLVSKLLDTETLGKYQILMAFLWNIQSAAMYISGPYVHNFYRLNETSREQYSRSLRKLGLLIVPFGVAAVIFLMHFAFHITVSIGITAASLLFSMMSFIYLPWILKLNREGLEIRVLLINVLGTIALMAFILVTNFIFGLTFERMLWIVTIQQIFLTIAAFAANRIPKRWLQS